MTHRVFSPKIYFTPLVLLLGGQVGHQKKQNSSRNWLFWFRVLLFSQNWTIFKNVQNRAKKCPFWVVFESLLNFGWKVAHKTISSQFLEEFCFFWCPTWPPSCETSGDISGFTLCFDIWEQQSPLYFFHDFQSNPWSIFTSFNGNISGFSTDY